MAGPKAGGAHLEQHKMRAQSLVKGISGSLTKRQSALDDKSSETDTSTSSSEDESDSENKGADLTSTSMTNGDSSMKEKPALSRPEGNSTASMVKTKKEAIEDSRIPVELKFKEQSNPASVESESDTKSKKKRKRAKKDTGAVVKQEKERVSSVKANGIKKAKSNSDDQDAQEDVKATPSEEKKKAKEPKQSVDMKATPSNGKNKVKKSKQLAHDSTSDSGSGSASSSDSDSSDKNTNTADKTKSKEAKPPQKPSDGSETSSGSGDDASSDDGSDDDEEKATSQKVKTTVPATSKSNAKSATQSESEEESGSEEDSSSGDSDSEESDDSDDDQSRAVMERSTMAPSRQVQEIIAKEFHLQKASDKVDSSDVVRFFREAAAAGKQIWYFTAPATVPIEVVQKHAIDLDKVREGQPILTYNGNDYNARFDEGSDSTAIKVIIPGKSGVKYNKRKQVDKTLHIKQVTTFAQNGQSSGTVTQSRAATFATPRPQPKDLKASFPPPGVPLPKPTVNHVDVEMTQAPALDQTSQPQGKKRKAEDDKSIEESKSTSSKKSKKVKTEPSATVAEDDKSIQESKSTSSKNSKIVKTEPSATVAESAKSSNESKPTSSKNSKKVKKEPSATVSATPANAKPRVVTQIRPPTIPKPQMSSATGGPSRGPASSPLRQTDKGLFKMDLTSVPASQPAPASRKETPVPIPHKGLLNGFAPLSSVVGTASEAKKSKDKKRISKAGDTPATAEKKETTANIVNASGRKETPIAPPKIAAMES